MKPTDTVEPDVAIKIEFDQMPPRILTGNGRPGHWSRRWNAEKIWHAAALWRLREVAPDGMWGHVSIQYTAHFCGTPMDPDNLVTGMKAAQDAVVTAGMIPDDGHDYVTILPVKYVRVKHRHEVALTMEITEVLK